MRVPATDPAYLPAVLAQLVADLADPAVHYLLGAYCYDRDDHARQRYYPGVFALHRDEVSQVEVGAGFLAFETRFVRYPEPGEAHAPGPWVDRFRARIPLAQLYQVLRRELPNGPDPGEPLAFALTDAVYYDTRLHREGAPSPWEITGSSPVAKPVPHPLVAILERVRAGLTNPANHYLVCTNSFETDQGLVLLGTLHLHARAVWELAIGPDRFTCQVALSADPRVPTSPVTVYYEQVWQVLQGDGPAFDGEDPAGVLYVANEVLARFAQTGRPATDA